MNYKQKERIVEDLATFETNEASRAELEEYYYTDRSDYWSDLSDEELLDSLGTMLNRSLEDYRA